MTWENILKKKPLPLHGPYNSPEVLEQRSKQGIEMESDALTRIANSIMRNKHILEDLKEMEGVEDLLKAIKETLRVYGESLVSTLHSTDWDIYGNRERNAERREYLTRQSQKFLDLANEI